MRLAVGHSDDPDSEGAVSDVLQQIEEEIGQRRLIALSLYACKNLDHAAVVAKIRARFPDVPLVGCSTDGECSSVLCFSEDSLVLTAFLSDRLEAHSAIGEDLSKDLDGAVQRAWRSLTEHGQPSIVIVLAESLGVSGSRLVQALDAKVPKGIPVVGGTAGDQWAFERTWQICGDRLTSDAVVMLALYGPLRIGVGIASGWQPMGPRSKVTRSEGPVVAELDGQRAQDWFEGYFGAREQPSPEHPFAVYDPPDTDQFYLRAPFQRGPDGAIIFTGDIPAGSAVRITEATREAILGGAADAVRASAQSFEGAPSGLLVFSCAARKQVLGTRTREEIERLRDRTGRDLPLAGFYTYGEIARLGPEQPVRFHNETVVAVLLGE